MNHSIYSFLVWHVLYDIVPVFQDLSDIFRIFRYIFGFALFDILGEKETHVRPINGISLLNNPSFF